MKKALITGITGQDGSYLAELLLHKNYEVHGIVRRASNLNTQRIDHLLQDKIIEKNNSIKLHYGDLTDTANMIGLIHKLQPDEIYNLGAQSHVAVSFDSPEYTSNVDALGTLRLLEAIRLCGFQKKTKFYQASTSELYGLVQETPQTEATSFYPRSPYAVAKLYAYWMTINYREAYNMFACNGILFNHESSRRGETFVTRKITRGLARIAVGLENCIYLGNLNALRDWGHAKDYVEMQWLMLQQKTPKDYVISSGTQHTVRDFLILSAKSMGIDLVFTGQGLNEIGVVSNIFSDKTPAIKKGQTILKVDPKLFRPTEVESLLGNPQKAYNELGWKPRISFKQLCAEMVNEDLKLAHNEATIKEANEQ